MYKSFENMTVWQEAHKLVLNVYRITNSFPSNEIYGLTSQMRRSSSSVPTNIVEGKSRGSKKDYLRFLYISRGSLEETKYHLILAKDLGYINEKDYVELREQAEKVGEQLFGLMKSLQLTDIVK